MEKFRNILDKIVGTISVISYGMMLFVVFLQIFSRVALPSTPSWTEEASRYLMIFIVTFCSGLAIQSKAFVNVDTIFNFLNQRNKKRLQFIINCILMAFYLVFLYAAIKFFNLGLRETSVTMPVLTMSLVYISMPLMGAEILIYLVFEQLEIIRNLREGA